MKPYRVKEEREDEVRDMLGPCRLLYFHSSCMDTYMEHRNPKLDC